MKNFIFIIALGVVVSGCELTSLKENKDAQIHQILRESGGERYIKNTKFFDITIKNSSDTTFQPGEKIGTFEISFVHFASGRKVYAGGVQDLHIFEHDPALQPKGIYHTDIFSDFNACPRSVCPSGTYLAKVKFVDLLGTKSEKTVFTSVNSIRFENLSEETSPFQRKKIPVRR